MAFEKGKNQNKLTDKNINKIIETYRNRVDVDKYAHVASLEEIKANEFNLNIPRYVDTFEEEQVIDLDEVNKLLEQDKQEIAELEAKINEQLKILGIHV
ncbi:N-6 DNA methylase [Paenibacillus polymyxa]|uniref:N-6 DNA methylase n=1 Tax=Paenibacillus polymyxa TaxID=1406 RepID=UPI0039B69051